MAKIAFVEGTFPELPSSRMYHSGRGEGANAKAAISRAMGDMLKKIKGKRISIIKAQITLTIKAQGGTDVA
jgi:hypothetical protein